MSKSDETGRSWHDMGGLEAGQVPMDGHDHALWEKRVDALRALSSKKGFFTVDGLRRSLEGMGEQAFETMTYYERWMASTCENLIAEGAFTTEELNAKMAEVRERGPTYGEAQGSGE